MFRIFAVITSLVVIADAQAELYELLPKAQLLQIAGETSGEEAKRNLDTLTLHHRMRAGDQFDEASAHVLRKLREYGLDNVELLDYPADGETMFGTQKSRPKWNVRFAELWEVADVAGKYVRRQRFASWQAVPLSLAQDSLSGAATTTLVDIGTGSSDVDYEGKELRGKLVLTSSQPGDVVDRAVGELGAVGIVSYAPNQRSAWWKQDDRLVRWGHIGSFPDTESFAFMISLGDARRLRARLGAGEEILFLAAVDASHEVGRYSFAQAAIAGADPGIAAEDILFTCHLDHPRPGANDNASGCVSILEVARTLSKLIGDGILPRPARSIRFLWPAEIEGSIIYLTEHADPSRIVANIHMDMVGGGPQTKAVFRISGGPISLPTFISDLGFEIGRFVNAQTEAFASGDAAEFPLAAPEGGKEPLLALMEGIDMGSDHDVFREGSFRIPGLYLHDWPDRYIHTNFDTAAMIDPTKLKRAAFIGAVSAWFLANMDEDDVPAVLAMLQRNALGRSASLLERLERLMPEDRTAAARIHYSVERQKISSVNDFASMSDSQLGDAVAFVDQLESLLAVPEVDSSRGRDDTVYIRNAALKGPMGAFGYSYAEDKLGDRYAALQLPRHSSRHGSAGEYVYEALNLVDGQRDVSEIRDWLMTELGPVPVEYVGEYLGALRSIGVLSVVTGSDSRL